MTPLLLAAILAAASPSAEAQRLGLQLAEQGTLASLLPLKKAQETEELLREDPSLSSADQAKLKATAERVYDAGYKRLMQATGDAYARELSVADLRALVSFYRTPAAARYREATPKAIIATMESAGKMDFKADVRTAFCAEAKRLCPSP